MELYKIISEKAHEITQRFHDVNFRVSFYHDELIFRVTADYGRNTEEVILATGYPCDSDGELFQIDIQIIEAILEEFYKNKKR